MKQKNLSAELENVVRELIEFIGMEPEAIWYPQSGPQSLAYISQADELFYGGSAGGGKTDLALGLATTAHLNSLFLRTEAKQLGPTRKRIQEMLRPGDNFRQLGPYGGALTTADGRYLELDGCDSFADANKKFRGHPNDLKIFDELCTFPKEAYQTVTGWTRTTVPGQRCRILGLGNPPANPEEEWVVDYWSPWLEKHTAEPGELLWFVKIEGEDKQVEDGTPIRVGKELLYPKSRTFIPARLEDNPILEATGYRQTLQNLPEPLRSQLLYGDMQIGRTDNAHQLIPTEWIEASMRKWRERTATERDTTFLTSIGVDPSRGGKDRSVLAKRYGTWVDKLIVIPGKEVSEGPKLATKVLMNLEYLAAPLIIDITGTAGGGLYDSLGLMAKNIQTYPFVASGASVYKDKSGRIQMRNKRTEAYWRLRDALDPYSPDPLILPDDKELKIELAAQRWYMYSGKAGIEDKDEIIKRLGRSPDRADAVAMSMMTQDATAGWVAEVINGQETFMGGVNPAAPPSVQHAINSGGNRNTGFVGRPEGGNTRNPWK